MLSEILIRVSFGLLGYALLGLIWPKLFSWKDRFELSRKQIGMFFAGPALALFILGSVLAPVPTARLTMKNDSMMPAITDQQDLDVKDVKAADLQRGDIAVFDHEQGTYVKRLIGLPKEKVEVRDGSVYVNGERLPETYETTAADYAYGPVTLGDDEYFFLGDNRNESEDSHVFGAVNGGDVHQVVSVS
jgi:signal peptidase I